MAEQAGGNLAPDRKPELVWQESLKDTSDPNPANWKTLETWRVMAIPSAGGVVMSPQLLDDHSDGEVWVSGWHHITGLLAAGQSDDAFTLVSWILGKTQMAGLVRGRDVAKRSMDLTNGLHFDKSLLRSIYDALNVCPAGWDTRVIAIRGMIGDCIGGDDIPVDDFHQRVDADGARIVFDVELSVIQAAFDESTDGEDLAQRLANIVMNTGVKEFLKIIGRGVNSHIIKPAPWQVESLPGKEETNGT
jgi:hypothetical protein